MFAKLLPPAGWCGVNREALLDWLEAAASAGPAVAVFDWDNTCIFNDIGDAFWRYQLDALHLRLRPELLAPMLPPVMRGVTMMADGTPLAALSADIMEAYRLIWPHLAQAGGTAARGSAPHLDFRAKLGQFYHGLEVTPGLGPPVAYPWLLRFLHGYSAAEIGELAGMAWTRGEAAVVGVAQWEAATVGESGRTRFTFRSGLRVHHEMRSLMSTLRSAGIETYVVSASAEAVVRSVAARLGFHVAAENVFGMRLDAANYPLTYRRGKVEVIERFLPSPPVLVAGDANTDYDMLTHFAQTQVRLLINRNAHGPIRTLYAHAAAATPPGSPRTLLQGRDENLGIFHDHQQTTPLGHQAPLEHRVG